MKENLEMENVDVAVIVREVMRRLQPHLKEAKVAPSPRAAAGEDGVFPDVNSAVRAATEAQRRLGGLSLDDRAEIIEVIRRVCAERAEELGRMEYEESRIGRPDHKVEKMKLIKRVLGVEFMKTEARKDASGVALIAYAPFGVIGMVTPATHSVPTMAGNAINVIAGGNTAVFSPHPAAFKCFLYAIQLFNREIHKKTGLRDLLCVMREPSIESANQLFKHPGVSLLCVTGGPAVVKAAMMCGKRVIAAGPGNPPVVVDESANLDQAARDIIAGASFDNNLLCIGEKEVFVVDSVADAFLAAMKKAGAVQLEAAQIELLAKAAFTYEEGKGAGCGQAHVKRGFVGQSTQFLGAAAGASVPQGVDLLFGETAEDHVFVQEEQMMPFLPIVRVPDIDAAIRAAVRAEHGYKHTAIIHTQSQENATKMARALNTTLFLQNASCSASLGLDGPGYLSFSIATPTGEGVTTPLTFCRQRQMVIGKNLNFA